MRTPPKVAAHQIVIIPILRDEAQKQSVMDYCDKLRGELRGQSFGGQPLRVKLDARDIAGGDKRWEWIKKGAPILIEVGPRDVAEGKVCITRRDQLSAGKRFVVRDEFVGAAVTELTAAQKTLFDEALALRKARTVTDIKTWAEFEAYFSKDADNSFASGQGFVRAKWSGDAASLAKLDPLGVTVRCIPFDQDGKEGICVLTGAKATQEVIFARAY
jgi:prolyl-tRNA synthetase